MALWLLGWSVVRAKSLIAVLACLLLGAACAENSPAAPTVPLNEQFTLAPGQSASVRDTPLTVEFLRVTGDSRCPADTLCVQGGDAIVQVRATTSTSAQYELHTGDQARATAIHGGFRVALDQLQPYPFSSRTIEPGDYRATLTVTR
ncbi:MAG: hypothetical protein ACRD1Q_13265 [Vicinamibacterales bacterium]